jgi:uncharacterized membrane protein
MKLIFAGLLLWSVLHFLPALDLKFRKDLVSRLGLVPYKGLIGVLLLASIGLIIIGWKSTEPVDLYTAPGWGIQLAGPVMLVSLLLFFAPYVNNSISHFIRHPQLIGIVVGSAGHLLAGGSNRELLLFGGMMIWSIVEIILLNRRNGPWLKPELAPLKANVRLVLMGIGFYLIFLFTHELLFGVSPFGDV